MEVKSRLITVTGPRGSLTREFKHLGVEIQKIGKRRLRVDMWFGTRRQQAAIRTLCTHIENMIIGVTKVNIYNSGIFFFL